MTAVNPDGAMDPQDAWKVSVTAVAEPVMTLFCLHHAGGGAEQYRRLARSFPADWTVHVAELPGRGGNARREPLPSMAAAVAYLAPLVRDMAGSAPFAFFGHSLGGWLGWELATSLTAAGSPPAWLGVSGAAWLAGPDPAAGAAARHDWSDDELVTVLRELGGAPSDVLEDTELLSYALWLFRCDLRLLHDYRPTAAPWFEVPVGVFGGRDDPSVPVADLTGWRAATGGPVTVRAWPGGHFYLHEHAASVASAVVAGVAGTR